MASQTHQGRLAGTRWDPNQYLTAMRLQATKDSHDTGRKVVCL